MDPETVRAILNECAALPICMYRIEVLTGVAPLAIMVMMALHLYKRRRSHLQKAACTGQQVEERRQELLQKLTFFFSSLRYIYNKYPADRLSPALQAERQAFLETDFRNLTALSALSLPELENLYAAVQRECMTGKWRDGVTALEQRVEAAVREADLHQRDRVRGAESDKDPNCQDGS